MAKKKKSRHEKQVEAITGKPYTEPPSQKKPQLPVHSPNNSDAPQYTRRLHPDVIAEFQNFKKAYPTAIQGLRLVRIVKHCMYQSKFDGNLHTSILSFLVRSR